MQQNIQKFAKARDKGKSQINKDEKNKISKKSKKSNKSSLLKMLSSNIVSENTVPDTKQRKPASVLSVAPPLAHRSSPSIVQIVAPTQQQLQNQQPIPPTATTALASTTAQVCPLCGKSFEPEFVNQHMQEELVLLAAIDDDDDAWIASFLDREFCQPRPVSPARPVRPLPPPKQDPKVYILGGTPAMAVPRNPKKLQPLPEEYKRQVKPVKAYNYYADGGGNMDGDAIGLDGFTNVGVGWEGVGATTF